MARKVGRCLRIKKKKRVLSQSRETGQQLASRHDVAAVLSTKNVKGEKTGNKKGGGSSIARKAPQQSSSHNIKKKTVRSVVGVGGLKKKVIKSDADHDCYSSEECEENDDDEKLPTTENDIFIQQLIAMNKDNERDGIGALPFEEDGECDEGEYTTNQMSHSTETARKRALIKNQVKEKLALREHLRQLKDRKSRIRRGEDAPSDRRELGKYIRKLDKEQKEKHAIELQEADKAIEEELKANMDSSQLASMKTKQEKLVKNMQEKHRPTLFFSSGCGADKLNLIDDRVGDDEKVSDDELRSMFAHLTA